MDPARSIRAGRGRGAVKPLAARLGGAAGVEAVTTGSGETTTAAGLFSCTAGALTRDGCCSPADGAGAYPPAAQKARNAASAEITTAKAILAGIMPRATEVLVRAANTSSRSPCVFVFGAKSRGTGPSVSG